MPNTQHIVDKLEELHKVCHKHGAASVVMTIPECERQTELAVTKRNTVNEALRQFSAANKDNTFMFDLYEKIQYHSMDPEDKALYWSDGLHLTSKGYAHWGDMLFQFLRPWLKELCLQKFPVKS